MLRYLKNLMMGIIEVKPTNLMAFIQYFSEANSESLNECFVPLLKEYGMIIPQTFENSKQLFATFNSKENHSFATVNLLISWVDQREKKCSVEIWSDEPFARKETLCRQVHQEISQLITPKKYLK